MGARGDRPAGPAVRGAQGRALLPALRDDAVLARGRARLRGRGRPKRVPRSSRCWAARTGCSSGRRRRGRCRATSRSRSRPRRPTSGRGSGMRCLCSPRTASAPMLGEGAEIARAVLGPGAGRQVRRLRGTDLQRPAQSRRLADPRRRLRDDRGRHRASCTSRRLSARTTFGSPPRPRRCHSTRPSPARFYNPVRPDGTYDGRVRSRDGRVVRRALRQGPGADRGADRRPRRARTAAAGASDYEHSYPHCWRCGTPLIYYAKTVLVHPHDLPLRERMLAANETVSWYPPHVKHGRFGDWLKGNVDWALSRERYWGTPLPVWRCAAGTHAHDRLVRGAGERCRARTLADHHRPYVDEVTFPLPARASDGGEKCGEPMRRVPEVIDVWFDSGAMPFAQHHYPVRARARVRAKLPGGLHLRGAGPDARLVLLAAGDRDAAVERRRPTGTWCAWG